MIHEMEVAKGPPTRRNQEKRGVARDLLEP